MKPFNELSPAQAERLAYLLEELGEAQQAIGKILRHGYESRDPTKATPTYDDNRGGQNGWRNTSPTNRAMLERELGDVQRAVAMLCVAKDLSMTRINETVEKGPPLKYMHHQSETTTSRSAGRGR